MKIIFALLLAVVGGALFAQPYYTAYQMRAAADRRDHEALASYIDFPAVRASLKRQGPEFAQRQVAKKVGEGPLSELGGLLGSVLSDRMIDAAVTPESLGRLMAQDPAQPAAPSPPAEPGDPGRPQPRPEPDLQLGYTAWNRFEVTSDDHGQVTRMVLGRQGLAWRLIAVILEDR
tara:strand:+ start:85 stop:609 length:525 start_codon:yes stop_codon:yes gene_type:complete